MNIQEESIHSKEAEQLLEELSATLEQITGSSGRSTFHIDDVKKPRTVFVVAREDGIAVGCGALREISVDVGELKRIYSSKCGQGTGTKLLQDLEQRAKEFGYKKLILETRKCNERAVKFYMHNGYRVTENYGPYIGNEEAVCFGKEI